MPKHNILPDHFPVCICEGYEPQNNLLSDVIDDLNRKIGEKVK